MNPKTFTKETLTNKNIDYFLKTDNKYTLTKDLTVTAKQLIINLPIIVTLNKFNLPYRDKYFITDGINNELIYQKFSFIYETLIDEVNEYIYQDFKWYIWHAFSWYNNFAINYCQAHHMSIDIENLVKTVKTKPIQDILNRKMNTSSSITAVEKQLLTDRSDLMATLSKLDIPENQFKTLIGLKLTNEGQLGHLLQMIGYRTNIDDKTIPKLITGNYLDGLSTDFDYITENLSDKKAKIYNKLLMPQTQYWNRKLQLASFNLKTIHKGDCGTSKYNVLFVTQNKIPNIVGKNILINNKSNRYKYITLEHANQLVGKSIKIRSPLSCLHTDGVCEVCGGKLVKYYMNRLYNVGHVTMLIMNSIVSQNVLSAKHYQTTTSREYIVPVELSNFLKTRGRFVYLDPKINKKDFKLGFKIRDAYKLINIDENKIKNFSKQNIYEYNFGVYHSLVMYRKDNQLTEEIDLNCLSMYPKLSRSLIWYLLNNADAISYDQNMLYVDLSNYRGREIFSIPVINYSIKVFYDNITKFYEKELGHFVDTDIALDAISGIVYEKFNVNIVFLELILRAFTTQNELDLRIGSIENNKTHFNFVDNINKYRNIGNSLAFQGHLGFLRDPAYYLIPKALSPMDVFLNFNL